MPAVRRSACSVQRATPYPSHQPTASNVDKENESPQAKSSSPVKKSAKETDQPERLGSYHDIVLEEKKDEVPCYESASAIRRKLNTLIEKKSPIPGSNKAFNKTTLSKELTTIAEKHHPIKSSNGYDAHGPSPAAITRFLKKSGTMGGGDSEVYYYGNMLLEKLRIWKGEKTTNARKKAEEEYPMGRMRVDPATMRILCRANERPSRSEVARWGRE
ncbi:hypothetical protein P280DRAFT_472764 [Massarina eburnea CBS 473.64]|uniref:Uncharacterized protein n=1 Tax=Massarina eburnea CBS 473.64 TaxID=1395130 RepID=A0A6A6RQL0_9PLEO|nr:hypothetical protein P280DRAFT_472764 [Massarina eburnea CBS 473.64]